VAVLDLREVRVVRDNATLLDGVTWRVDEGQRWVILGPNGAGKTTMVQIAAARAFPSSGSAEVLDERLGQVDVFDLRPRIGLTSAALADQIPANERVLDVVLTGSYAVVGRWREAYDPIDVMRAEAILTAVGVVSLGQRRYATLSEGERKRVQIARALMADPELMLLDEPAAGLDLGGREDLVARLARIAMDPTSPTMVLITHHVEEIPPGFTHVLLLRDGRVVAGGPLAQTLTSDLLSQTFGMALEVSPWGDRWWARAVARVSP
jgi:iron complex transport system ATP-binding protein